MFSLYNNLNQLGNGAGSGFLTISGTLNKPGAVTVASATTYTSGSNFAFTAVAPVVNGTNNIQISATNANGYGATYTLPVNVSVSGGGTFSYDLNGNMLSDGVNTYEWDAANRLTAINEPGGLRSEFKYDGQGRRVCITEKNEGTVTSVKNLIWEGMGIAEARDQTNTLTNRYFDQGVQLSGTNFYYTRDHLGSIREIVATSATLQARYGYDPYGRQTQLSGTMTTDFGYTGDYFHAPSQLCLTLYRAYSPNFGRWLSRDPSGESSGINLYEYVEDEPISNVDYFGLDTIMVTKGNPIGLAL
jgi:RHS repeat-associated protein